MSTEQSYGESLEKLCDELLAIVKMLVEACSVRIVNLDEELVKEKEDHYHFFRLDTSKDPAEYTRQLCEAVGYMVSGLPSVPSQRGVINLCVYKANPEQMQPGPLPRYMIPLCLGWKQTNKDENKEEKKMDPAVQHFLERVSETIQKLLQDRNSPCLSELKKLTV